MYSYSFGWIAFLIYLVIIAIGVLASYWVIRLAVFHAMKAHTRWLQGGQR